MSVLEFLPTLISEAQIERLGWVLLHSLWQFTAVSLLIAGVLRVLRSSSAVLRDGVLVAALTLMVGAAVVTGWLVLVPQMDFTGDVPVAAFDESPASQTSSAQVGVPDVAQQQDAPVWEAMTAAEFLVMRLRLSSRRSPCRQ